MTLEEETLLERVIERMTWEEIHAYQAEMQKGQSVYEDAGGFILRGLRRLFGLKEVRYPEVINYQNAARAMMRSLKDRESHKKPNKRKSRR